MSKDSERKQLKKIILERYPFLQYESYRVKRIFFDIAKKDSEALEKFPINFVLEEWVKNKFHWKSPKRVEYLLESAKMMGKNSLSNTSLRKVMEAILSHRKIPFPEDIKYINFIAEHVRANPDFLEEFPADVRPDIILDTCEIPYYNTLNPPLYEKCIKFYAKIAPKLDLNSKPEDILKNTFEIMKKYLPESGLICSETTRVQSLVAFHSGKLGYRMVKIPTSSSYHAAGEFILPDGKITFFDALWEIHEGRYGDPTVYSRKKPEIFGKFEDQLFSVYFHSNGVRKRMEFKGPDYLKRLEHSRYY
jgi:hypothetical protein